jgi:hypothetical protein
MMDWKTLYCPQPLMPVHEVLFNKGLLVKNGSSHGKTSFYEAVDQQMELNGV